MSPPETETAGVSETSAGLNSYQKSSIINTTGNGETMSLAHGAGVCGLITKFRKVANTCVAIVAFHYLIKACPRHKICNL